MTGAVGESPRLLPELADEAATEEDGEAAGSTGAGWAASRRRSAACTAAVLCTALLALAFARRPARATEAAPSVEAASLSSGSNNLAAITHSDMIGVGDSVVVVNTGCKNWKTAALKTTQAPDAHRCVQECRGTEGCFAVNYQFEHCSKDPRKMHAAQGLCDLLGEECDKGWNHCWTLYTLPVDERYGAETSPGPPPSEDVGAQESFNRVAARVAGHFGS